MKAARVTNHERCHRTADMGESIDCYKSMLTTRTERHRQMILRPLRDIAFCLLLRGWDLLFVRMFKIWRMEVGVFVAFMAVIL